jgi:hypothetical protein
MRRPGFRDGWMALKLYELRRDDELRAARDLVGSHLFTKTWDEIEPLLDYDHPQNAHLRQVIGYWELAASLVLRGIFHPEVYLDTCDEGLFTYATLEEHLPKIRERRPNFFLKTDRLLQEEPQVKGRLMEIRKRIFKAKKEQAPNPVRD